MAALVYTSPLLFTKDPAWGKNHRAAEDLAEFTKGVSNLHGFAKPSEDE